MAPNILELSRPVGLGKATLIPEPESGQCAMRMQLCRLVGSNEMLGAPPQPCSHKPRVSAATR
jgi:hypothetical protein